MTFHTAPLTFRAPGESLWRHRPCHHASLVQIFRRFTGPQQESSTKTFQSIPPNTSVCKRPAVGLKMGSSARSFLLLFYFTDSFNIRLRVSDSSESCPACTYTPRPSRSSSQRYQWHSRSARLDAQVRSASGPSSRVPVALGHQAARVILASFAQERQPFLRSQSSLALRTKASHHSASVGTSSSDHPFANIPILRRAAIRSPSPSSSLSLGIFTYHSAHGKHATLNNRHNRF